jgi:hypothetical protein
MIAEVEILLGAGRVRRLQHECAKLPGVGQVFEARAVGQCYRLRVRELSRRYQFPLVICEEESDAARHGA